MKRILIALLVVALLIAGGVSYADVSGSRIGDVRKEAVTITNTTGHVHVTTSPAYVWRVTLTNEATATKVQLYDSSTTGAQSTINAHLANLVSPSAASQNATGETMMARVKADIGPGTALLTTVINYDPPLYFDSGILAGFVDKTTAPTSQDDSTATIEFSNAQ